jgi:hypothetical protein
LAKLNASNGPSKRKSLHTVNLLGYAQRLKWTINTKIPAHREFTGLCLTPQMDHQNANPCTPRIHWAMLNASNRPSKRKSLHTVNLLGYAQRLKWTIKTQIPAHREFTGLCSTPQMDHQNANPCTPRIYWANLNASNGPIKRKSLHTTNLLG